MKYPIFSTILFFLFLTSVTCKNKLAAQEKAQIDLITFQEQLSKLVEQQEVIGMEVLIVKEEEVYWQEAFGWKDQEAQIKMDTGNIFNIRSMTKPMAGTVAQILIDRGKLKLEDKVATYLPSFDNVKCKNISIEQLLLHRAGYEQGPPGKPWTQYQGLRAMADYWGEMGPSLAIDSIWSYADAHSDILGAIVEVITGKDAGEVLKEEIFQPLSLKQTFSSWPSESSLIKKIPPLYGGQKGDWRKLWSSADGVFFSFTMYAQSVFSSARDYARFMQLWMDEGKFRGAQIISKQATYRAFSTREPLAVPDGLFPISKGKQVGYGHFWGFIYEQEQATNELPFAFLHQGSDGTAAYAFPALDLIAIFMTQSRGMSGFNAMEKLLMENIVDPLLKQ